MCSGPYLAAFALRFIHGCVAFVGYYCYYYELCRIPLYLNAATYEFCSGWVLGYVQFGALWRKPQRMFCTSVSVDTCTRVCVYLPMGLQAYMFSFNVPAKVGKDIFSP